MDSALYEGWVRHRRFAPVANAFRYSLCMAYLDLDELDSVFRNRWFWSASEFNLAWFRRDDYMTASSRPSEALADTVRAYVFDRIGSRPSGPIRILTNLRNFGFSMNPVNFYYCFNDGGKTLHSIVAEITNTPWNEQFAYVFPCGLEMNGGMGEWANGGDVCGRKIAHSPTLPFPHSADAGPIFPPHQPPIEIVDTCNSALHRFRFKKTFHVSPYMDMAVGYDWRFNVPDERIAVHMLNLKEGATLFDSTLLLTRRAISTATLAGALVKYPFTTLTIFAAIYFQAAKLWVKRCPSFAHPKWLTWENRVP